MLRMRSKLFVPGSRPELFKKATLSAADALSFDLEDAVSSDRKEQARDAVSSFLHEHMVDSGKIAVVRVNPVSSPLFSEDVAALVGPGLDIINLPKVESAEDIKKAVEAIESAEKAAGLNRKIEVLATIETPKGLRLVWEIASADTRVIGLQVGFVDLFLRRGISREDAVASQSVRFRVRMAAAEAGIDTFDGAFLDVKDEQGLRSEAEAARRLGYAGKSCIHPAQISAVNEIFSPRADEIAHAKKVLAAAETADARGVGAFTVDGSMVDAPVIERARAIVSSLEKPDTSKPKLGESE